MSLESRLLLLAAPLALLTAPQALAEPNAELVHMFSGQIENVTGAVDACEAPQTAETWQMSAFFLELSPSVGVTLGGTLQLSIIPEIDLIWQSSLDEQD